MSLNGVWQNTVVWTLDWTVGCFLAGTGEIGGSGKERKKEDAKRERGESGGERGEWEREEERREGKSGSVGKGKDRPNVGRPDRTETVGPTKWARLVSVQFRSGPVNYSVLDRIIF